MDNAITEKAQKIEDGCIEYANAVTEKLYSGFTAPSKTGSSNGSIISICLKHGGVDNYRAAITSIIEKECNTYADTTAERHYSPMTNPANFGSTKGAIFTACLQHGGISTYQDSITHGLPETANINRQLRK